MRSLGPYLILTLFLSVVVLPGGFLLAESKHTTKEEAQAMATKAAPLAIAAAIVVVKRRSTGRYGGVSPVTGGRGRPRVPGRRQIPPQPGRGEGKA